MTVRPSVTREQLATRYNCSHAELGRLLRGRRIPLPVRIDGATLWYSDEVEAAAADAKSLLDRRRKFKER